MDSPWSKRSTWLVALAAAALALVVYTRTMLPGVGFWDTGEFQTVAAVLGIAHPTGYPLYTLVGKAFTWWPFGSIAWRVSLMSGVSAAVAAGVLVLMAGRLKVNLVLALSAALGFAFSSNVWSTANRADPHTLHAAIVAVLWLLVWRWAESGDRRYLWGLALGAGLGLGNHMLMVMELPALGLYAWLARPRDFLRPGAVGLGLLMGTLGLLVYAYIPLRAMMEPPLSYAHPTTWERFRYVVLAEQFQGGMGFLSLAGIRSFIGKLPEVMSWYAEWLSVPGRSILFGLAFGGMGALAIRNWRLTLGLFLGALVPFYAASTYVNADLSRYYIVPNWILFLFAAVGAQEILSLWQEWRGARAHRRTAWILAALTLVLPYLLIDMHWKRMDQSQNRDADRYQQAVLETVKPRAVVISWWSFSTPLWYGRYVEGRRPDVEILDDSDIVSLCLGDVMGAIKARYPERPVYLTHFAHTIEAVRPYYQLERLPPLNNYGQDTYEVVGRTEAPLPPPSTAANVLSPL